MPRGAADWTTVVNRLRARAARVFVGAPPKYRLAYTYTNPSIQSISKQKRTILTTNLDERRGPGKGGGVQGSAGVGAGAGGGADGDGLDATRMSAATRLSAASCCWRFKAS